MTTHAPDEIETAEQGEPGVSPMSGAAAALRLLLGLAVVSVVFVMLGWGILLLVILAITSRPSDPE